MRQYLSSRQIDEMHLAVSPVLRGECEALFLGMNLHQLGYKPMKMVAGKNAIRVIIKTLNDGCLLKPSFGLQ
jgi:dihydrofolate reductase